MRAPGVVAVSMVVQLVGVVLAGALVLLAGAFGWDSLFGDGRGGLASGPFGQLVADQGKTSFVSYEGDAIGLGLGAEGNLGIGVGLDIGGSTASATAMDAAYLGAPGADGSRERVPFLSCVA